MPNKLLVANRFYRDANKLQKRYPHVLDDLEPLRNELVAGETPGDRLQGLARQVYKVRLRNSDVQRGKSGGYRVIYYLKMTEQVVMLTIYSKSDQSDIPTELLRRFIEEYEAENPPTPSDSD